MLYLREMSNFAVMFCILRYIKSILFHYLHFSVESLFILRAYSKDDWANDPTNRCSTTNYCFFLGDSLIS